MPEIEKNEILFYRDTPSKARQNGEIDQWRASNKENQRCISSIDDVVRKEFDGSHLDTDRIIKDAAAEFGMERVAFVLASHVADHDWDGRFHKDVKDWANSVLSGYSTEVSEHGKLNNHFSSHSVLVDGLVSAYMKLEREIEKELSSEQAPEISDESAASTNKEKVRAITEKLEQGVKDVFSSDRFKDYLKIMSKFHRYSMNNTMLIMMQRPDATLVKGFQAWKKDFGRNVNKGEKGIQILAPSFFKKKEEQQKRDPITDEPMFDKDGKPIMETVEVKIPYFKTAFVFDVSQTSGKELPTFGVDDIQGDVKDYDKLLSVLEEISPFPIKFTDIDDGAKGRCRYDTKEIELQKGMSELQTIKTALHEITHSILHNRDINEPEKSELKDRNTREVEAESVAYTVCTYLGLDVSDYSFDYVTDWSTGKELTELKGSLEIIQNTASKLISDISARMQGLEQTKEQTEQQEQRSDLIGNTLYKEISDKQYMVVYTSLAEQISAKLNEQDIHFSGKIKGYKTTFTISKSDVDTFRAIEKEVRAAAKEEREKTNNSRPDIIGNTPYGEIADRKFIKVPTEKVPEITEKLNTAGIKFSGRISGDSTTITVSNDDMKKANAIIEDGNIEKRSDIIGNTPFKEIPDREFTKLPTEQAQKVAAMLEELGVKFSGRIADDLTTLTVSRTDLGKVKAAVAATEPKLDFTIYIIPDLKTWKQNAPNRTPIERFDSFAAAKARFMELRRQDYNHEHSHQSNGEPYSRLTLGIEGKFGAYDIIHVRDDRNVLITDFAREKQQLFDKTCAELCDRIAAEIGFDTVLEHAMIKEGVYASKGTEIPFAQWDNKYFGENANYPKEAEQTPAADETVSQEKAPENAEKKQPDIIGNIAYGDIKDRTYLKIPTENVPEAVGRLNANRINFSGKINEDTTTLTVTAADIKQVKEILSDIIAETKTATHSEALQKKATATPDKKADLNIIGNTPFKEIPQKNYIKTTAEKAQTVAPLLEEAGIRFSGRIDGDKATLTISKSDMPKVKEILSEIELQAEMSKEHNFRIEPTENNTFVVLSDSARFGTNAITFESYDRDKCVEYITKQRPTQEWGAYIIPDMKPLVTHEKPLAPIEHFETLSQAIERFNELRSEEYNGDTSINPETDMPFTRLTLGIENSSQDVAFDLIHVMADKNVMIDDFTRVPAMNTDKACLDAIKEITDSVGVDEVLDYSYASPELVSVSEWDNPYFDMPESLNSPVSDVEKSYPPVYRESAEYAVMMGEVDEYRESKRLNTNCYTDIRFEAEAAEMSGKLGEFTDMLAEDYGADRIMYVIAQTIIGANDGSFSKEAQTIANRPEYGDGSSAFSSDVKPSVLEDIFMKLARSQHITEIAHEKQEYTGNMPDETVTIEKMNAFGYTDNAMLPISGEKALEMFDKDEFAVYLLYPDGTEGQALERTDIENHTGMFGIETEMWEKFTAYSERMETLEKQQDAKEAMLLNPNNCMIGIYQIRDDAPESRDIRFEGMKALEQQGKIPDRDNYILVYTCKVTPEELSDKAAFLEDVYTRFNIDRPKDFIGHSLSVSDVVVVQNNGDLSANFVDSAGYKELESFGRIKESPIKTAEQLIEQNENSIDGIINNTPPPPSMSEIEQKVKNGEQVSLMDIAAAVQAEDKGKRQAPRKKPSIIGRIKQEQGKASQKPENDDKDKTKKKGVTL